MTPMTRKTHPLTKIINHSIIDLPTPSNLPISWNFGSMLGICLLIQIMTGLFLSIHYIADTSMAFSSIVHICHDIMNGWLLRNLHANGASMFFICLFLHAGRGLYYGSFLLKNTWNTGIMILFTTMATAFMGYVLPWGQMSFWGATVITNLLSATPYIGSTLVQWIWGGFSVDNATLTRFFAFHFILPFIISALITIHLLFLHETGSSNPTGLSSNLDKTPFHTLFSFKDLLGFWILLMLLSCLATLFPNILSDPDNFIPANPMITPPHIKPEWYFLFAYAILRSIPNKLGGVIALLLSILILISAPTFHSSTQRTMTFRPAAKMMFWSFTANTMILTWIGAQPVENPFIMIGQLSSIIYFLTFILPHALGFMENKFSMPISQHSRI